MKLSADGKTLIEAGAMDPTGTFIIPEHVTEIVNWAFENCTGLTSISIHHRVTRIGYGAFNGCTGLISMTIHNNVTKIGEDAFSGCARPVDIILESPIEIEGSAFNACISLTSMPTHHRITKIGRGAFRGCVGLTSIIIPEGVTEIGEGAFIGCVRLTNIIIPECVTEIGVRAFCGCTNLQNIVIDTKNESEFERIKQLFPEELKRQVVPMSVFVLAKRTKERLIDDFCNQTSGINPLDGHTHLPADVIGAISAWSDEFSPANQLKKALDNVVIPTNELLSGYERRLNQLQTRHVERVPLYCLKNHLLNYKKIMETPSEKPSSVRQISFFNVRRPNEHSRNLCTWIRHQALTKILDWIETTIDSEPLLANVPDLVLSEDEKTAIRCSQLMKGDFIPADFDFKAMLAQNEPPSDDARPPALK